VSALSKTVEVEAVADVGPEVESHRCCLKWFMFKVEEEEEELKRWKGGAFKAR
jgi:hypothetical protein